MHRTILAITDARGPLRACECARNRAGGRGIPAIDPSHCRRLHLLAAEPLPFGAVSLMGAFAPSSQTIEHEPTVQIAEDVYRRGDIYS